MLQQFCAIIMDDVELLMQDIDKEISDMHDLQNLRCMCIMLSLLQHQYVTRYMVGLKRIKDRSHSDSDSDDTGSSSRTSARAVVLFFLK